MNDQEYVYYAYKVDVFNDDDIDYLMRNGIYTIFGKNISQNLVEVNYEENNIKVTGFVGNTTIAVDTRKDELFFLNKRFIQNQTLYKAADEAFKGDTGIGKFSFAVINLSMPPSFYDVNIHPTKKEVKFKEEDVIYRTLYSAIKNAVLSKSFLGNNVKEEKKYDNRDFTRHIHIIIIILF